MPFNLGDKVLMFYADAPEGLFPNPLNFRRYAQRRALASFFNGLGFATGRVSMPELGIGVCLQPDQYYREEEHLDIQPRKEELFRMIGTVPDGEEYAGFIQFPVNIQSEHATGYIILVTKKDSNTGWYGHEHGHLLWELGYQRLVYQQFSRPMSMETRFTDTEDFALLCQILSLRRAGVSIATELTFRSKYGADLNKAYRVLDIAIEFSPP